MYHYAGTWKSFDDVESNLCLAEMNMLIQTARDAQWEQKRFAAALKGVDLDKQVGTQSRFDEVKRRAQAKAAGVSEEEIEYDSMFEIDLDEEEGDE